VSLTASSELFSGLVAGEGRRQRMTEYLVKTWDFIERMEQAQDAAGVEECLLELAHLFGFTSVFGGVVPGPQTAPADISSSILVQRLPIEWKRRYNGRGYVFRDPIVQQLQSVRTPFSWDDAYARCADTSTVRLIRGEAGEFGLVHGHVVPVPTLDGKVTAISFGGQDPECSKEARDALTFAAGYAVGRLLHVPRATLDGDVHLTPREADCLLWAAEGKTDLDIAVILGITRSTVLKHLRSARDKLDAANRTHAVVKAMRRKLIG